MTNIFKALMRSLAVVLITVVVVLVVWTFYINWSSIESVAEPVTSMFRDSAEETNQAVEENANFEKLNEKAPNQSLDSANPDTAADSEGADEESEMEQAEEDQSTNFVESPVTESPVTESPEQTTPEESSSGEISTQEITTEEPSGNRVEGESSDVAKANEPNKAVAAEVTESAEENKVEGGESPILQSPESDREPSHSDETTETPLPASDPNDGLDISTGSERDVPSTSLSIPNGEEIDSTTHDTTINTPDMADTPNTIDNTSIETNGTSVSTEQDMIGNDSENSAPVIYDEQNEKSENSP